MAETIKIMPQERLEKYLQEQQSLTAVERFSSLHESGHIPHQQKYYKSLLPAAPPNPGQQYAFEVNLDACSGCKACVTACHNLNGLDEDETWRAVGLLQGKRASVQNIESWDRVLAQPVEDVDSPSHAAPAHYQQNITTACHHCADPACLNGCPVNAYHKDEVTGIVKHLDDQCIGCQYCTYKCPYSVPQYSKKRGIVRKCDMCTGRLQGGEAPACVQACPNQAIHIAVVDILETKINPGKHFQIPSSPDPHYTQPTTRYVSSRPFPTDARPSDDAAVKPQNPEYPLAFMLVFTQASVGAWLMTTLFSHIAALPLAFLRLQSVAALSLGFLGLGLATLHLGRPLYAFRVIVGLGHSWLSREAVVFGLFAQSAAAYALLLWIDLWGKWVPAEIMNIIGKPWLQASLVWIALFAGLFGVFCSGMIYIDTPREWWRSKQTMAKFFLTTGILGAALYCALSPISPLWKILCGSIAILSLAKLTLEATALLHLRNPGWTSLKKTALLLKDYFRGFSVARIVVGLIGCGTFAFTPFYRGERTPFVAGAGFLFLLAGELIERHLFFRAVVPPQMPGTLAIDTESCDVGK